MSRCVLFFLSVLISVYLMIVHGCAAQDKPLESPYPQPGEQRRSHEASTDKLLGRKLRVEEELLEERLEEERKKAEAERIEQGETETIKDVSLIMDKAAMLINDSKFDEAHKLLNDSWQNIDDAARKGMANEDAGVRGLYQEWRDGLVKTRQILADKELPREEKREKAMDALVKSGRARQAATLRQILGQ